MDHDILDDTKYDIADNSKWIFLLIVISTITIIAYFIIEFFRDRLPINLYETNEVQISTMGLVIIGVVVFNSLIIPTLLNKFQPVLSHVKVLLSTGIILFAIEIVFKVLQVLLINDVDINVFFFVKGAIVISGIGILIANVRIHKLRSKGTLKPTLVLIVSWMVFVFLQK